jgi:hypothetical protein
MARVKEVIQREMPAGPDMYGSKESALAAEPDKPVVDAVFPTREKAKNAAYRVNDGERREAWPKERYAAIFHPNPAPQSEPDENGLVADAWELLIIPRSQVPQAWLKEVNAPGSRRKNRDTDDDSPAQEDNGEPQSVEQEFLEPVAV